MSNVLTKALDNQYDIIRKNNIVVINVVRDGRDVVLSDGKYVKPRRWIESIKQKEFYKDVIALEVKYEDLIREPQAEMENTLGLVSEHNFSDYPDYVEDWVFDWNVSVLARKGLGNEKNYGKRKLSEASIGKDLEAYKDICSSVEVEEFENCLSLLGYT